MYEFLDEAPDMMDWSMILSVKHCSEIALIRLRVLKHNGTNQILQIDKKTRDIENKVIKDV